MHYPSDEESTLGPVIGELLEAPIIEVMDGLNVRLVDRTVPEPSRVKIAHVGMCAQRAMPTYTTGYDGTIGDDQRLYVLADGSRAIGFVVTAFDGLFWRAALLEDGRLQLRSEQPSLHRGPKIGRVWIAPARQRNGLAFRLLEIVIQHLRVPAQDLGWELPFTPGGQALVRRFARDGFLACGGLDTVLRELGLL